MSAGQQVRSGSSEALSLPEKVTAIHRSLRESRIPHAIGGALALAYYAEPRATIDVDINVFVPTEQWPRVRAALEPLGVDVGLDESKLERDGQVRLWWGRNPVDLFFSYDPVHEAMREGARRVPFGGETIPILSPEHLTVCKAMFNRPKDWLDIEQILVDASPLNVAEVLDWLERMVGPGDQRIERLLEIRRQLSTLPPQIN
jgi:hypothetical protein